MNTSNDVVASSCHENDTVRSTLERLGLDVIPPHPVQGEKGKIKVYLKLLDCDNSQLDTIKTIYAKSQHFHQIFTELESSQSAAREHLQQQNLLIDDLGDLGNRWSRRWSTSHESAGGRKWQRILFQCQSGISTTARKMKVDRKKFEQGRSIMSAEWKRKIPYDYTGCLAHLDLTYDPQSTIIYRITGIFEHDEKCKSQLMSRLPAVPVHPHVWQDALKQINNGANMAAVQKRNHDLFRAKLYHGQKDYDPAKANHRYILLPGDSRTLYRKQAKFFGVNLENPPAENVDNWLNPESTLYRPELASAAFFYQGRTNKQERFMLCIQTPEMKTTTWEYSHNKQLIIDGTFGICDRRILLFIALGVDRQNRGIPLAFFLFSAPTGNRATHAGYDTSILTDLLKSWAVSLGKHEGQVFSPKIVITDTDTRERGAILSVWPHTTLLLCKFHTRQCWTNKRKLLVKGSGDESHMFYKDQVIKRLQNLERVLIDSENFQDATASANSEKAWLSDLQHSHPHLSTLTTGAISYINYLSSYWLSKSLWESWSAFGRIVASRILGTPLDGVIPTTNHLEAFNGVLKHKYIHQYQKNGRRIRFDLLIMLLITKILPGIYVQRNIETRYYDWLSARFGSQLQSQELVEVKKLRKTTSADNPASRREYAVTWWSPDSQVHYNASAQAIIAHNRISDFKWIDPKTVEATCASSLSNTAFQDHLRYTMSLNCYGLAACTCPHNSTGNGACKHLWAFRYILPTLSPTVSFYFPLTEKAALDIHQLFFPSHVSNGTLHIADMLPEPPKNHLHSIATISNTLSSMVPDSDSDASSDFEESENDADQDFTDASDKEVVPELQQMSSKLASDLALKEQLKGRITQEVAFILPRLHGVSQLLSDAQDSIDGIPEVSELRSVIDSLHTRLSGQTAPVDGDASGLSATPDTSTASNARKQFQKTLQRQGRRVLPPSPERNQKRKRSTATY